MSQFEDKFKEKTGNNWVHRNHFVKKGGKYNFMKVDHGAKVTAAAGPKAVWQYYVDDHVDGKATGWYDFTPEGAANSEALWVVYQANGAYHQRIVESGHFSYLVDLSKMTQQNVTHHNAKVRLIRRVFNGIVTEKAEALHL